MTRDEALMHLLLRAGPPPIEALPAHEHYLIMNRLMRTSWYVQFSDARVEQREQREQADAFGFISLDEFVEWVMNQHGGAE